MDKASKLYAKALKEYYKANIDKALELCEKSISLNLRNPASLNLKGLLLYLKGELDGAKAIWRLNKDLNKDRVSKKYLLDSEEDEKRRLSYNTAMSLIKDMRIREAVKVLRNCEESGFNSINVGNALAICLIKQGKYDVAEEYINKVLSIDCRNKDALENKRMLIEYGGIKKDIQYRKIAIYLSFAAAITALLYGSISRYGRETEKSGINNNPSIDSTQGQNAANKEIPAGMEEPVKEETAIKEEARTGEKKEEVAFPHEELKNVLEQKEYSEVYDIILQWKDKSLGVNEISLISKGEELLKEEGVGYFYELGLQKIEEKNFGDAVKELIKAYSFGTESYLHQHILYMLGFSYEKLGDIENALKYYEYYANNYSTGNYIETVLYNTALLYKNINLEKARFYAEQIISKYPGSMYNNTRIGEILIK